MSLICHESVRNGDHFQRWAEKRLRGSVQEVSKSFELRHSDALGVHAVARSAISAGDLIIAEDALLRILPLKDAARRLLERFGDLEGFLQPALGVDWGSTDKEVREAALELFYAHPITERRSQESAHITACEELLQMWPPLRTTGWSPAQLLRFLHIVDLNIHKDERPSHAEFTGIFVLGSKFSHSCEPNASWSFDQRGRLQYGAIRPIAAGEVLTFSYVGNGMNLITSTLVRRQRLATLCFICRCERCKGPDLARPLPCPRCRGECLPCYPDQDESGFGIHGSRCDAIEDAVLWRCTGCEAQVAASELPLQAEAELAELVPQVMQAPPDSASEDAEKLSKLRVKAAKALGPGHWACFLATFAWLQKCLVCLRNEPVITFSEAELHAASVEVARWLEVVTPKNVEQRLCALFMAARLARQLGGGVRSWGYDPECPLGEELQAATRTELRGWELKEDCVVGPEVPQANFKRLKSLPSGPPFLSRWV